MPRVRTNDVATYYARRGDGPPIVFVHGAIVDHDQWAPQADALSDEYTTVAYDVRGHGRTGGSTVDRYSIELFAEDLDALVTALDLEAPVVCGLSMGGCIAQVYTATYPETLSGLVLADTFTPGVNGWPERLQFAMLRATIPPTRLVGYERVERAMVWILERIQGEAVAGDRAEIDRLRAAGPRMETDEFAKVVRALGRFRRTSVDLSSIAVPTLVLHGEHEVGFVAQHSAVMAAEIPNATRRVVPDAAHVSNLDNPEFFTTAMRAFLAGRVFGDATDRAST